MSNAKYCNKCSKDNSLHNKKKLVFIFLKIFIIYFKHTCNSFFYWDYAVYFFLYLSLLYEVDKLYSMINSIYTNITSFYKMHFSKKVLKNVYFK